MLATECFKGKTGATCHGSGTSISMSQKYYFAHEVIKFRNYLVSELKLFQHSLLLVS